MVAKLLVIVQKNKHHLVFILSVFLSLIIIYNSDSTTIKPFQHTINNLSTIINSPIVRFNLLVKTAQENELLRERLIVLFLEKESLLEYEVENARLKEMLDFKRESKIEMIPAKVINMGLSANLLSMTVDVGSDAGVKKNNPVITPSGIIGKIAKINDQSSVVQLISDPSFRIGVRFLPSGTTGILRWAINNICNVREVYKNSIVNVGDQVVTSGLSDIFPEGLHVGTVSSVADDRIQFQKIISVQIEENLSSLMYVFVIINNEPY
ncbi:rod shape-determining protein MreC [bacterium]|nr:rod shape-determining protein MreC [bacterium]